MPDVTAPIIDLIGQVTDVPAADIGPASRFEDLTNWNSLAALALLTAVEDRFGVKLDLRAYFAVTEVRELASLVSGVGAR
jgi:acyl carrier protein